MSKELYPSDVIFCSTIAQPQDQLSSNLSETKNVFRVLYIRSDQASTAGWHCNTERGLCAAERWARRIWERSGSTTRIHCTSRRISAIWGSGHAGSNYQAAAGLQVHGPRRNRLHPAHSVEVPTQRNSVSGGLLLSGPALILLQAAPVSIAFPEAAACGHQPPPSDSGTSHSSSVCLCIPGSHNRIITGSFC